MANDEPQATDDDGPAYVAPVELAELPAFVDRLVGRLIDETAEELVVDGVELEQAQGVWLMPTGAYDPGEDDAAAPIAEADLAHPANEHVAQVAAWTQDVRRVLRETWGDPVVRTPRVAGAEAMPESILDHLLVSLRIPEAEVWDRGVMHCALITGWAGEPGTSMLRQIAVLLPRDLAMGGMAAVLDDEGTIHDGIMHGEHVVELHRRAWIRSSLLGVGEVRLRDTAIGATRCSVHAGDTTTVWIFADDGRALLLVHDPTSDISARGPRQLIDDLARADQGIVDVYAEDDDAAMDAALDEARTILSSRLLAGVPADLRSLVAARGEDASGQPAPHDLAFVAAGADVVPIISGAAWFDGEHWHVPASLTELGRQNGFGLDDFAFDTALRVPHRLGGTFTVDDLAAGDDELRARLEPWFAACPYPEQARPTDAGRLGAGVPPDADVPTIVEDVERASTAWWEQTSRGGDQPDEPLRVGGIRMRPSDDHVQWASLGVADPWTVDALGAWTRRLHEAMDARWGPAIAMDVRDPRLSADRRTPVSVLMRSIGIRSAPLWWVDGHAVLLLRGQPDPEFSDRPQAILLLAKADAVFELLHDLDAWGLRRRLRILDVLATRTSDEPDRRPAIRSVPWDGPALAGSTLVPAATQGVLRTGSHTWAWHLTHRTTGPRALLMAFPTGSADAEPDAFDSHAALLASVPAELRSLVVDRDADGHYPIVRRPAGTARDGDPLPEARTIPAVQSIHWLDGMEWRTSEAALRRARDAGRAAAAGIGIATADPLRMLWAPETGVPQLRWAVNAGGGFGAEMLANGGYEGFVVDRPVDLEMAEAAIASLGEVHERALVGSLDEVLDLIDGLGGHRALRSLLDLAVGNPDPDQRLAIALWLLERGVDASVPLSPHTPLNVLMANPTLRSEDADLVAALLRAGAVPGLGPARSTVDAHPLVQLAARDLDDDAVAVLTDAWLSAVEDVSAMDVPGHALLAEAFRAAGERVGRPRTRIADELDGIERDARARAAEAGR
ncbi:hypothetical protein [Agrococcus sp. SGAir0287]|uniref:hypothetical protein n=1 Tax=Agrococcus sp. SGAir0287 TaxID=2070347 RepID=UPI0010CD0FA6|nr:hypothetical protein [Agrococcus sp. SGAir0287]QCR20342.1 hypothetical protein C1N71_13565 [Agrococcus sp. SGAir0287]